MCSNVFISLIIISSCSCQIYINSTCTGLQISISCDAMYSFVSMFATFWLGKNQWSVLCFLLGDSPASEFYEPTFRNTVCSIFIGKKVNNHSPSCLWRWNRQSVPNRRLIKFRRWGVTQKKTYNIQNTVKVWNKKSVISFLWHYVTCIFVSDCGNTFQHA
jgi:hypothetical protein